MKRIKSRRLIQTPSFIRLGFLLSNFLLIIVLYYKIDNPTAFLLTSMGLVVFSFSLQRAIYQLFLQ